MVVAAAFFIVTINAAISFIFGVLLVPISEDMGWSRGQLSLGYALEAVSHALFAVPAGWLTDRFGVRRVLVAGGVLLMLGLVVVGWRSSITIFGIGSAIIILTLSLLIYYRPEDVGLKPYGAPPGGASPVKAPEFRPGVLYKGKEGNFFQFALRTQPFLLLPLIHFLSCVNHTIPMAHRVAMAEDSGMAPMVAAGVVSLMTGFSLASHIASGLPSEARGAK